MMIYKKLNLIIKEKKIEVNGSNPVDIRIFPKKSNSTESAKLSHRAKIIFLPGKNKVIMMLQNLLITNKDQKVILHLQEAKIMKIQSRVSRKMNLLKSIKARGNNNLQDQSNTKINLLRNTPNLQNNHKLSIMNLIRLRGNIRNQTKLMKSQREVQGTSHPK